MTGLSDRRRAEALVAALRWVALALGIVAAYGDLRPSLWLIVAGALVAHYNAAVVWATRSDDRFARGGPAIAWTARCLDFAVITMLVRLSPRDANFHLLYIFAIVTTAYVHETVRGVAYAVVASVALNALAAAWQEPSVVVGAGALVSESLLLVGAAVIGAQLVSSQRQTHLIRHQDDRLAALLESAIGTAAGDEPGALLRETVEIALRETHGVWAGLFLKQPGSDALALETSSGSGPAPSPDDERIEHVLDSKQALLLLSSAGSHAAWPGSRTDSASVVAPLLGTLAGQRGEVLGVLLVQGQSGEHRFDEEDLELVRALAAKAALVIANTSLYHRLHASVLQTMQSLARSLEARDDYSRGHSQRVAELSRIMGQEMGLDEEAVDLLVGAALLHDIGRIGIPDYIPHKTTELSPEEWQLVRDHPVISCEICRPLDLGDDVLFLIRHHHERLNGRGYPDQLPSHEQPLPLRILCVADTFDAMSTDRPYRRALDLAARVEELNRGSGLEFDQRVVETLKLLLNDGRLAALYAGEPPEPAHTAQVVAPAR
jgi:GAF domain-containing protein